MAAGLVLACYFFTPPAGAHLVNPNIPVNINYVYGFNDRQPQHWVSQNLYVCRPVVWRAVVRRFFPDASGLAQNLRQDTDAGDLKLFPI
jgi:hypothetical protein